MIFTNINKWKTIKAANSLNENAGSVLLNQVNALDQFMMHKCQDKKMQYEYENEADQLLVNYKTWDKAIADNEDGVQDLLDKWGNKAAECGFSFANNESSVPGPFKGLTLTSFNSKDQVTGWISVYPDKDGLGDPVLRFSSMQRGNDGLKIEEVKSLIEFMQGYVANSGVPKFPELNLNGATTDANATEVNEDARHKWYICELPAKTKGKYKYKPLGQMPKADADKKLKSLEGTTLLSYANKDKYDDALKSIKFDGYKIMKEGKMSELDLIGKDAATKAEFITRAKEFLSQHAADPAIAGNEAYLDELASGFFNEDGSKKDSNEAVTAAEADIAKAVPIKIKLIHAFDGFNKRELADLTNLKVDGENYEFDVEVSGVFGTGFDEPSGYIQSALIPKFPGHTLELKQSEEDSFKFHVSMRPYTAEELEFIKKSRTNKSK